MRPSTPPSAKDEPLPPRGGAGEHPASNAIPGLELGTQLKEGLFSWVFKARTFTAEGYEEPVAVKLWKSGTKARGANKPNGPSLLALKHVNVVRHLSEGAATDGTAYVVMEYARGQTLEDLLQHGPIEVSRAVSISRQLARALVALHGANLLHGDLKPNHVLLVEDEHHDDLVKLCDVGAKALDFVKANSDEATWLKRVAYVAPEQLADDTVTPRSDLYSAGMILFQMLTGSIPAEEQPATKLVALLPRYVPRALKDVVLRLIQKEPSLRFSSAEQWLTALDQIDGRDQDEDELLSSSPRSAFIAGGLSRTAPPGSVRPASSIRKAPWGLDAGGFKWWAVACGMAAVGAAAIVGYRMYTHTDPLAKIDPVAQTTNAQHVAGSPQSPADILRIPKESRSAEMWLRLCQHYQGTGQLEEAEVTFEQALRQHPALVQGSPTTMLLAGLGTRREAFLGRIKNDTSFPAEVRAWASSQATTSP